MNIYVNEFLYNSYVILYPPLKYKLIKNILASLLEKFNIIKFFAYFKLLCHGNIHKN